MHYNAFNIANNACIAMLITSIDSVDICIVNIIDEIFLFKISIEINIMKQIVYFI